MTKKKLVLATVSIVGLMAVAWLVGFEDGPTSEAAGVELSGSSAPRGPDVGADPPELPNP